MSTVCANDSLLSNEVVKRFDLVFKAEVGFRVGVEVLIGIGLVFEAGIGFRSEIRVMIGDVLDGSLGLSIKFSVDGATSVDSIDILPFKWLCTSSFGADGFSILSGIGVSFVPLSGFGSDML